MNVDGVLFICIFLPLVLLLDRLISNQQARKYLLLSASLIFCAFGSISGVLLLTCAAAVNFLLGKWMQRLAKAKILCGIAVGVNLAFLGFFKYLNFFVTQILHLPDVTFSIVAPIGISFYVFKCISYLVDISRQDIKGAKNFGDFLLYVSFFPQLTAGPIARFADFQQQPKPDISRLAQGIRRFVVGLSKKLLLAGTLAKVADGVFGASADALDFRVAWLGAITYMLQIYFDFSGYSDMAIGLGNVFGYDTPENFRYPYAANSVSDFWRRWHISLSLWFRDYLYIPLGGNRKGAVRTALHKLLVFALCGIWHGAAWSFALWGLWHGIFTALESGKVIRCKGGILSRIYTLLAVCLGFVLFRADSVMQAFSLFGAMIIWNSAASALLSALLSAENIVILLFSAVLSFPIVPKIKASPRWSRLWEPAGYLGCILLFALCLMKLASGGFAPFIYARF